MSAPPRTALRVLHLLAPAPVGGLESVVRGLAAAQHQRGHRVTVAASLTSGSPIPSFLDELRALDVDVRELRIEGSDYRGELRTVRQLCRELQPNVAHTHGYRSDVVAGHAAKRAGVPIVTTVHGFTTGGWKNQLNQAVQRLAFRRFDAVVAVSEVIARRVVRWGVPRSRVHLVPNGHVPGAEPLDRGAARDALALTEGAFRFGWVGRVQRDKGLDVLIEALAHLCDVPWTLSVIGDGPDLGWIRERATVLGIAERIAWHGAVDGAGTLMRAFDAFVLSSRTEGTPMVLLEAMAAGVPVVVTAVGGVPAVVGEAEGLVVPPERPEALAGALRVLLDEPTRASERAVAALQRIEREFGADQWLDRYDHIYRAVARPAAHTVDA